MGRTASSQSIRYSATVTVVGSAPDAALVLQAVQLADNLGPTARTRMRRFDVPVRGSVTRTSPASGRRFVLYTEPSPRDRRVCDDSAWERSSYTGLVRGASPC